MARETIYTSGATGKVLAHYKGFSRETVTATLIAHVYFSGDIDIYGIDDAEAIPEIKRMYRDDYDNEPDLIVIYGERLRMQKEATESEAAARSTS